MAGYDKAEVNRLIRYHSEISWALTAQRTALESALIPITAYILVACVECYRRYPEMIDEITAARAPEEIGASGRTPGSEIDTVRLWSVANFPLVGRSVLAATGMLDWEADIDRMGRVFEFWRRAASSYRDDGTLQCADAGGRSTPFAALVPAIMPHCVPLASGGDGKNELARVARLNALLTSYEFLLWFDTRAGYQDSGPYPLPDGRTLLLRQFVKLGVSDFPWSARTAAALPYHSVLAAFVLGGVDVRITDFGTAITTPDDYLPHVEAFAMFDTSAGALTPIGPSAQQTLTVVAKDAQRAQYRLIAGMNHDEKLHAGAYVYFAFLRPFAIAAGVDDALDWTVPRDSNDLYPFLSAVHGSPDDSGTTGETYYPQIP